MQYRALHKANQRYQMVFLWTLAFLFVVAWVFMFVHPSITILVFWLGLVIAGIGSMIGHLIRQRECRAAKRSLDGHACPQCGERVELELTEGTWHCHRCDAAFLATGAAPAEH